MTGRPDPTGPAVGIDGCPGGWIAARLDGGVLTWATAPVAGIGTLLDPAATIGIDMPIGLLESGLRECDAVARRALPGASSRVFTTPPRAVLELGPQAPNDEAQALSRRLTGSGVSRQALNLAPRILALDAALADVDGHQVVEVHPEVCFAEMSGRVLPSKKATEGVDARLDALRPWLADVDDLVAHRPTGVPVNDAVDALAALWSAIRWRDGRARTLPADATGRPFIAV